MVSMAAPLAGAVAAVVGAVEFFLLCMAVIQQGVCHAARAWLHAVCAGCGQVRARVAGAAVFSIEHRQLFAREHPCWYRPQTGAAAAPAPCARC
jgi:hypothetical protein